MINKNGKCITIELEQTNDGRETQEGGHICTLRADTHCCMAKINTILSSNYLPIKQKDKTIRKNKIILIILKRYINLKKF